MLQRVRRIHTKTTQLIKCKVQSVVSAMRGVSALVKYNNTSKERPGCCRSSLVLGYVGLPQCDGDFHATPPPWYSSMREKLYQSYLSPPRTTGKKHYCRGPANLVTSGSLDFYETACVENIPDREILLFLALGEGSIVKAWLVCMVRHSAFRWCLMHRLYILHTYNTAKIGNTGFPRLKQDCVGRPPCRYLLEPSFWETNPCLSRSPICTVLTITRFSGCQNSVSKHQSWRHTPPVVPQRYCSSLACSGCVCPS